jgi:hypothetical protein
MDKNSSTIEDLGTTMRSLSGAFYRWSLAQMGAMEWSQAVMEVRYASDGSYWNDKMRVGIPGRPQTSLGTTQEIREFLIQLNGLRRVFPNEWFSFKLTISKAGEVHVDCEVEADVSQRGLGKFTNFAATYPKLAL